MPEVAVLSGVGRVFGGPVPVVALEGISFSVESGAIIALTGPSGSGKSTLLNILGLLDSPSHGTYWLQGETVSEMGRRRTARRRATFIGFVFQSFHLTDSKNVIDNVAFGAMYQGIRRHQRYRMAMDLIHELGLSHRATAMPSTLSGGEKQRVAIARAVIGQKRMLLCDEPSGNLDSESTKTVLSILRRMAEQGIAVVIATHDPLVADAADVHLGLTDGHLIQASA